MLHQPMSRRPHGASGDNFISTIIKFDERNDLLFFFTILFGPDPDSERGAEDRWA